jgi:hypothetical protein
MAVNRDTLKRWVPLFVVFIIFLIFIYIGVMIQIGWKYDILNLRTLAQLTQSNTPVTKKLMVVKFDPIIESEGGRRISDILNANGARTLSHQYIADLKTASKGYITYDITTWEEVDHIPQLIDGHLYTDQEFLACARDGSKCHSPSSADYYKLIDMFQLCDLKNSGAIDEVWFFGPGGMGFMEARMAGPNGFFTNGGPLSNTTCENHLHIMGFNYTRTNQEMLESLIHRIEGTMKYVWEEEPRWSPYPNETPWGEFAMTEVSRPGGAVCGWAHYAPNSERDYDMSNPRTVNSSCDGWGAYPQISTIGKTISCNTWGCTGYGFFKWWLNYFPANAGTHLERYNNWWKYVVDYGLCPSTNLSVQTTCDSNGNVDVSFSWSSVDTATKYQFQLDNESSFTNPLLKNEHPTSTSINANDLSYGGKYYARVRSYESPKTACISPGEWSTTITIEKTCTQPDPDPTDPPTRGKGKNKPKPTRKPKPTKKPPGKPN